MEISSRIMRIKLILQHNFLPNPISWSNLEDAEEFPEVKDDSPHNDNRRARSMTSPDVSAATAALAACTDAQRGMDIMTR